MVPAALERMNAKDRVRAAFARAAETYDSAALIQRHVVAGLARTIALGPVPHCVLELGCGTGNLTAELLNAFPKADITALDFCGAMLHAARRKLGVRAEWIEADAERFEPADGQPFDLITSSGAFQWFEDLPGYLARVPHWLSPQGRLVFAIFGPGTFAELQSIWPAPLAAGSFWSADRLQDCLAPHFRQVTWDVATHRLAFPSLLDVLRHIRATGTGGTGSGRMVTRAELRRLESEFRERFGQIVLSYEVITCSAGEPVGRGQ
jgi:malonyl-CoA O-methyltransferase